MKKSRLETNPHLKDTATRNKALARDVASSSAIEGIRVKRDAKSERFVSQKKDVKAPARPLDNVRKQPLHGHIISIQPCPNRSKVFFPTIT